MIETMNSLYSTKYAVFGQAKTWWPILKAIAIEPKLQLQITYNEKPEKRNPNILQQI